MVASHVNVQVSNMLKVIQRKEWSKDSHVTCMKIDYYLSLAANTKPLAGLTRASKMHRPAIAWILIWFNIQLIKYSLFICFNIHLLKIRNTQHSNTQAFRKLGEVGEGTASNCFKVNAQSASINLVSNITTRWCCERF